MQESNICYSVIFYLTIDTESSLSFKPEKRIREN